MTASERGTYIQIGRDLAKFIAPPAQIEGEAPEEEDDEAGQRVAPLLAELRKIELVLDARVIDPPPLPTLMILFVMPAPMSGANKHPSEHVSPSPR